MITNYTKIICVLLVVCLTTRVGCADEENHVPADSWEEHPGGIAIALLYSDRNENGHPINTIKFCVKNTGAKDLGFNGDWYDSGVTLYYVTPTGEKVRLHNYDLTKASAVKGPEPLAKGDVIVKHVYLTDDDMHKIEAYAIVCDVYIYDPARNSFDLVESKPKVMNLKKGTE